MNRIKEARVAAGLSQKFVAMTLGVAGPSVSNWESGKTKPTPENYIALAQLLSVSVDYLMGVDDISTDVSDPVANMSPESQALWQQEKALLEQMTPEQRDRVKEYMRFLLSQHHKSEA